MSKSEKVYMYNMKCIHNIAIKLGYHDEVKHVIIFMNSKAETFAWVTIAGGLRYEEGEVYNITAMYDKETKRLKYVSTIPGEASEQKDKNKTKSPVDIFDLIYNTEDKDNICYALDKRLNMRYNNTERSEV